MLKIIVIYIKLIMYFMIPTTKMYQYIGLNYFIANNI